MKFTKLHNPTSLRFRRWSRVGYAAFCSLACVVTIGCVNVSIADKSLQKTIGIADFSLSPINLASDSPDKLKEQADLEIAISQLHEVFVLSEKTIENAVACSLIPHIILNPTVEMSSSHLNRFLFY